MKNPVIGSEPTIGTSTELPTGVQDQPAVALRSSTQAIIEKTLYWSPPVADWVPLKKTRNSGLRIASVTESRLAEALAFEGDLLVLTPQNWARVLRYTRPDLLLVESMLASCTGHWHMAQHPASKEFADLVSLAKLAQSLSIPTVFWITKGHEYHEHFRHYARHFDLVCCADPKEVERLAADGIKAELLLPCVQPALYNPFRLYQDRNGIDLNVLFDGWADVDRFSDKLGVLRGLGPFGLSIIESRYELFRNRLDMVPDFRRSILGCVTQAGRRSALKYARAYATVGQSLSSATSQQWMSVEAAASHVPVVHYGMFEAEDPRRDFGVECPTAADYMVEFVRYREDDLYRQRVAHAGWRAVNQRHSYAHRLRTICELLNINHDWQEHPKASLITPTYRKEMLPRCLKTYEQIDYPNKELVLVYNGDELPSHRDLGLQEPRPDVVIAHMPRDLFAGATLNMGHLHATGDYCFRVDDDDYYAPNYIRDMIIQARSVDAALFGKPSAPLVFEGDETVYLKNDSTPFVIVSLEQLQGGKTWIGGNSISGLREFFEAHAYSGQSYGAADTDLILNLPPATEAVIALMDQFNMAAERRSDLSSHTWKNSAEKLRANRFALQRFEELVV